MDSQELIRAVASSLRVASEEVICAYVFGSVARGAAGETSDVDVAVLLGSEPADVMDRLGIRLSGDLERTLGRRVDLVVLNRASVDLVHRVLRDGIIVLDRDANARSRFEVAARNAYFDLKPYLDRYRLAS